MKRHNVILESNVEPKDKNVLWLQGNKLKKFGNTGWEDIVNEALALGAFHGYFPDSSSLPADVTTPSYAYVGLDNPYKIWKFNGELWSDSGTYIDVNDVDEEDITRNSEGKLQFKDRAYEDGMGYVILRKDKTFAEQVTQTNTIYEIRYNFDLNGTTITIPQGCVLKFNGGSLRNGVINGDNYDVISTNKCFYNIQFTGNEANAKKWKLDWFVSKNISGLVNGVISSEFDSAPEINSALASGIQNVVFNSSKFYYLKSPIIVNGTVNLFSDSEDFEFDSAVRLPSGHLPSVYSNEIVTLLDYHFNSSENYKHTLTIGKINFYCRYIYTNNDNDNTPIVKIETTGGETSLWGVTLNMNITAADREVNGTYIPSFVGLKIIASATPISYVRINGYIQIVRTAIELSKNGSWFTDVVINGDTRAVFGGKLDAGEPIRIFGSHQPISYIANEVKGRAYFEGTWINLYGFVWDINVGNTNYRTVTNPIKITSINGRVNDPFGATTVKYPNQYYSQDNSPIYGTKNALDFYGRLPYLKNYMVIQNLSYTLNDEEFYTDTTDLCYLLNGNNAFNSQIPLLGGQSETYHACFMGIAGIRVMQAGHYVLKLKFRYDKRYLSYPQLYTDNYLWFNSMNKAATISITDVDTSEVETYNISADSNFSIKPMTRFYLGDNKKKDIEITIVFDTTAAKDVVLPVVYIPMLHDSLELPMCGPSKMRPNTRTLIPLIYYDTDLQKIITKYSDSQSKWFGVDGYLADAKRKGTTAERPTNVWDLGSGFCYFDTTLGKPIWLWYNGSTMVWRDATGTNV